MPAAKAELLRLEPHFEALAPDERARYALYRGLSELGLGDARHADRWLSLAKRIEARCAACYDQSERGALLSAWRSLGRLAGETPPAPR